MENITGDTIDISEYLDFGFYYPGWYWDKLSGEKGEAFPERFLGISHRVGTGIWYWVLNEQGDFISQYTAQHITKEEILNKTLRETMEIANKNIKEKLADEKHKLEPCP